MDRSITLTYLNYLSTNMNKQIVSNLNQYLYNFALTSGVIGVIMYILITLGLVVGYFANIIKLAFMVVTVDFFSHGFLFIFRIFGILFAPLGAVLGWF